MSNPKISIVVVSLDNPEYFNLLMEGLAQNTRSSFEVLLHINVPYHSDEWRDVCTPWMQHGVLTGVTVSKNNLGAFVPANTLFKSAKGEYFTFLDDDVYPSPGWDEALLKKVNPNIKCQYLSPTLFQPDENGPIYRKRDSRTATPEDVYNLASFGDDIDAFDTTVFNAQWEDARNVLEDSQGVCGDFFMSAALWNALNGYDETFACKGADIDLKAKVWQLGMTKYNGVYEYHAVADSCLYHFAHVAHTKVGFEDMKVSWTDLFQQKWGMTVTEFWQKAFGK